MKNILPFYLLLITLFALPLLNVNGQCSFGTVENFQKISDTEGNFNAILDDIDLFGISVSNISDLNGDGVLDLVVGALGDDDGGDNRGAVYVLFMNTNGTVNTSQKISDIEGNFTATLENLNFFGSSVSNIGDLNGDGVLDLAVGAPGDNDGGPDRGAVYLLFMNTNGTVNAFQKISDTEGNFTATLDDDDSFGSSVSNIGDLNGDGVLDLVVGALGDDDGGVNRGAVYVLFMNTNGTVNAFQKISNTEGNFTAILDNFDNFGNSVSNIGDLNGNGVLELAVGAHQDGDGGQNKGAIYVLFMNTNGTVNSFQKISETEGNFTATLDNFDEFGISVSNIEDLNGDGVLDLAVGAYGDGGDNRGAVYVLFMNNNGTVDSFQEISDTEGNFTATLDNLDNFGSSVSNIGDLNGDGVLDLAVGAISDDDGGGNRGAVYILDICGFTPPPPPPPDPGQEPIPTLSQWGLLIFGLLILNLGVYFIHRKELM